MANISPYKLFWNWAFDNDIKSPIPSAEGIDILKYNSPITPDFLLKSFITNGKLNHYLDQYINNIGVRYIEKEDLFLFFKRCIIDFKVKRRDIHFSPFRPRNMLFEKVQKKFPMLKPYDISLFIDIINKSDEKDKVYSAFGIDKPKKQKLKKEKKKKKGTIKLKEFLAEHFNTQEL